MVANPTFVGVSVGSVCVSVCFGVLIIALLQT